ncbi:MAG: hypothetical protein FWE03_03360 [Firmicutes bacterium]|nr:hypothetical protein [Bacillota bacterium]
MQQQENYNQILDFIRQDNEAEFSKAIKTNTLKSLSFGRFSLLSLCYIYNSKKIIKAYEDRLLKIDEYIKLEQEPIDAYKTIKQHAGIYIRILKDQQTISPLIVLAILDKAHHLKQIVLKKNLSDEEKDLIIKIFKAKRGAAEFNENGSLITPRQKLKQKHKILMGIAAISLAIIIALPITIVHLINLKGHGTYESPFRIRNLAELVAAADQEDTYFILHNDITLPISHSIEYFNAHLKGGGHTIISRHSIPLAHRLNGSIRDLSFISSNASHLVFYNAGEIKNINFYAGTSNNRANIKINEETGVLIEDTIGGAGIVSHINSGHMLNINMTAFIDFEASFSDIVYECFVGLIVSQNWGLIEGAVLRGDVMINSSEMGEVFIGNLVGRNFGTVTGGRIEENFILSAKHVHVGGIVGFNEVMGNIFNSQMSGAIVAKSERYSIVVIGGLIGLNMGEYRNTRSTIRGNIIAGNIIVNRIGEAGGFAVLGGISGECRGGLVENNVIRTVFNTNLELSIWDDEGYLLEGIVWGQYFGIGDVFWVGERLYTVAIMMGNRFESDVDMDIGIVGLPRIVDR